LFEDPHIKSNQKYKEVGLYSKTFTLDGVGVGNNQNAIQKEEAVFDVFDKL